MTSKWDSFQFLFWFVYLRLFCSSDQRSAGTFHTSACCCASQAETVTAAAASSPRAGPPWPATRSAKAPADTPTLPSLRANQWVFSMSNLVCLCPTPPSIIFFKKLADLGSVWFEGAFLRHGGRRLVPGSRRSSPACRRQTGAPCQPEVKGEWRRVWKNCRPQPHWPGSFTACCE